MSKSSFNNNYSNKNKSKNKNTRDRQTPNITKLPKRKHKIHNHKQSNNKQKQKLYKETPGRFFNHKRIKNKIIPSYSNPNGNRNVIETYWRARETWSSCKLQINLRVDVREKSQIKENKLWMNSPADVLVFNRSTKWSPEMKRSTGERERERGADGDDARDLFLVTRVYKEKEHAEVEFTVGPIPVNDKIGKEVATQITSNIKSKKIFYTDSSGRDFIERTRNYRKDWDLEVNQPVAGNYYPINLGLYLKDSNTELSVLVDRSVGGSSIVDGQLELMLHRRLLHDDGRGVNEALNETVCVKNKCTGLTILGNYYLRIDPLGEGAKWRRTFGQEIYSPLLLAFAEQDGDTWANSHVATFSGMDPSYVLPDNVAMITLQELDNGKVLLRLAHLFEIGEDKDLSVLSSVELKKVFPNKKINKITEMSLSANQERAEMEKKRLVWKVEGSYGEESKVVRGGPVDPTTLVVELAPMEIRTFVIAFDL